MVWLCMSNDAPDSLMTTVYHLPFSIRSEKFHSLSSLEDFARETEHTPVSNSTCPRVEPWNLCNFFFPQLGIISSKGHVCILTNFAGDLSGVLVWQKITSVGYVLKYPPHITFDATSSDDDERMMVKRMMINMFGQLLLCFVDQVKIGLKLLLTKKHISMIGYIWNYCTVFSSIADFFLPLSN